MCLGQFISNTELLDLWQLCQINEKQYNMGHLKKFLFAFSVVIIYWFINCGDSFFSYNPTGGFVCRNTDQKYGSCCDYKVRFGCPCFVQGGPHKHHWEEEKIFNFLFLVCFFFSFMPDERCILSLFFSFFHKIHFDLYEKQRWYKQHQRDPGTFTAK